jgi:hypothetical protein
MDVNKIKYTPNTSSKVVEGGGGYKDKQHVKKVYDNKK